MGAGGGCGGWGRTRVGERARARSSHARRGAAAPPPEARRSAPAHAAPAAVRTASLDDSEVQNELRNFHALAEVLGPRPTAPPLPPPYFPDPPTPRNIQFRPFRRR